MSTSSRSSAKRRASSLARSRTSPTRRSRRSASSATTSSDRCRDASSSRTPSRSAETWPRIAVSGVRSSCETDMRKLRESCSDSASLAGHLVEASGEPLDLAAPRALRHGDVVVAGRDLVRRGGEHLERPRDPARVVDDEDAGDGNPDPERERELPERAAASGCAARTRAPRRRALPRVPIRA